jgi:hypothetical protein
MTRLVADIPARRIVIGGEVVPQALTPSWPAASPEPR